MKYLQSIFALVLVSVCLSGCDPTDFGDINKDPNNPSDPNTSFLFTRACQYIPNFICNSATYDAWVQEWTGYLSESKNNQFGQLTTSTTYSTSGYYQIALKNLKYIQDLNADPEEQNKVYVTALGSANNQIAAAKTLSAFYYMTLSDILGPIVYSEGLQGQENDIWKPKYDTQKDIYNGLFADLKTAYAQFETSGDFNAGADILFGGDIAKWKKFNASLRMMMAIKLSDVDPATGKAQFATAYSDGAMTTVSDGAYYTFDDNTKNTMYTACNPNYASAGFNWVPNAFIVDTLKAYRDNRIFSFFDYHGYKGPREGDENDMDLYFGIPFGLTTNTDVTDYAEFCCSFDSRLLEPTGSLPFVPASRMLFIQAEAALRGWISADPKALYEAGIRASFEEWEAEGVEDYLANPKVAYNAANGMFQICLQRWIASFFSNGVEVWSDWRRNDVPFMPVGPSVATITHYPYRFGFYGDTDWAYNEENLKVALSDLYGGEDNYSSRVWWDVKPNREGVYHDWLHE